MAKQQRYNRLDSGLIVPYWHSPRAPRSEKYGNVQFHPDTGNVLFTANGVAMDPACCCGGGTGEQCEFCDTGTTPSSILVRIAGFSGMNGACDCSTINNDYVLSQFLPCYWKYNGWVCERDPSVLLVINNRLSVRISFFIGPNFATSFTKSFASPGIESCVIDLIGSYTLENPGVDPCPTIGTAEVIDVW